MLITVLAILITIIAAGLEAYGYSYSFQAFENRSFDPWLLTKAFCLYSVGIWVDYFALFVMSKGSIYIPEILTVIFMTATIVGIALISGQFFQWKLLNQIIGVSVVVGLAWLTYRIE